MDLKNAVAVCLISLFSATMVVLIARALDSQAAARLEPQLASIVEELQAIRKQGGISVAPTKAGKSEAVEDGLAVYYFHGNTRCPTCQAIESQSQETVQADFAELVRRGNLVWKILNYEQSSVSPLAKKFEIQMPVVVLAKMKAGQIQDWKRLDEVWALVGDKPAFAAYVRSEIKKMLDGAPNDSPTQPKGERKAAPAKSPPDSLPLPPAAPSLPLPKQRTLFFPLTCFFQGDELMKRTATMIVSLLAVASLASMLLSMAAAADAPKDRVVVMYFHRTQRCPTCLKMGSYTEEAVKKGFAKEIKAGTVSLHFIDFQDEKNTAFTKAYGISGPTLIVAKASGEKVAEYKNLKEMWTKVRDKDSFVEYVQTNVKSYMK